MNINRQKHYELLLLDTCIESVFAIILKWLINKV